MRTREAIPQDAEGIATVIHAMTELRAVTQHPVEVTAGAVAANLERIASSGTSTAYVARDEEGIVVGYGAVHWVPFLFLPGGEAYVTELFIHPSASGKGAGSEILATITAEAAKRGCARVSLLNARDGESYQRNFYKDRGWQERDRMANFILPIPKQAEREKSGPSS
jgi:GNAT superfamily N-acetyltransferase